MRRPASISDVTTSLAPFQVGYARGVSLTALPYQKLRLRLPTVVAEQSQKHVEQGALAVGSEPVQE